MSLTGGLDTRMIMAWQKADPGSLPCYTFGRMFRECQDVHVGAGCPKPVINPFKLLLWAGFLCGIPALRRTGRVPRRGMCGR